MIFQVDRVVRAVLQQYVTYLAGSTSNTEWANVLGVGLPGGYSEADMIELRTAFRANPPSVRLAYARQHDKWPVWSVILSETSPDTEFVGKLGELIVGPSTSDITELMALEAEQGVMIACYAKHNPEMVSVHATQAFAGILKARNALLSLGLSGYGFRGMSDLEPAPEYLPNDVFVRNQNWAFNVLQSLEVATDDDVITAPAYIALDGVPLDDGQVGGVQVYQEGES